MKRNLEDIELNLCSEILKSTAATDAEVLVGGDLFVNIATDMSIMLKANWWPSVAQEFKTRDRSWPSKEDIEDLTSYCYIIAKPSDDQKNNTSTTIFSYSFYHIEAN